MSNSFEEVGCGEQEPKRRYRLKSITSAQLLDTILWFVLGNVLCSVGEKSKNTKTKTSPWKYLCIAEWPGKGRGRSGDLMFSDLAKRGLDAPLAHRQLPCLSAYGHGLHSLCFIFWK